MAHPTIFILALVASGISAISCGHLTDYSEVPVGSITEMTFGKLVKFTCPVIYGRYPHPENCEYFYECRFGRPTLMHCNRGYLYDRQREPCRDRRAVKCHNRGGGGHDHHRDHKDKDVQVKEDLEYFKCPYIWGTFAHPYDCSKYFVCIYNSPKLFQCNPHFLYDDRYRKCLPQNKVNCGKRLDRDQMRTSRKPTALTTTVRPLESTTSGVPVTTESHSKFHCPFPYGRYPDPEDCSRYYECRFSIPHLYVCPKSTLYDERKEQCFDEKRVKCGGRPGGKDEGVEPGKDDRGNFRCPYIWGTFVHPVDCSKYIVCIYNVPSIFSCRKNELFDAYYRRCLPKEKVSCDNRINPDDPSSFNKTTYFPTFTTLIPSTAKKIPELTTTSSVTSTVVTITYSTTTTPITTTEIPTTSTVVPTTATPATTTVVPTTETRRTTTTPVPTTATRRTTTTPVPTTATSPTTTTPVPTTATPSPTTAPAPTTTPTTIEPTTTTSAPTTFTTPSLETTTQKFSTPLPVTKPNTPPPTDCKEDDLDCIIDGTGDVVKWFDCPRRFGHFPHGSSSQLFIHCDNWRPFIKKCAEETFFSPTYHVCVWADKTKGLQ